MGKRKRRSSTVQDNPKSLSSSSSPSLGNMPCASGTELLAKEKSSPLPDSSELKHISPGMDVTDSAAKLLNVHSSVANQHYNLGRSIFLKRSRHYYGHQYSRRNSGNHANASSSHGKMTPLLDERLTFKFTNQSGSESGHRSENKEKVFSRPERIRLSSLVMDAVSSEPVKMVCGICQKMLRRKPLLLGDVLSSGELSIVGVLGCGHVYHADCLEQTTSPDDVSDPPCPLCMGLLSQADASRAQE